MMELELIIPLSKTEDYVRTKLHDVAQQVLSKAETVYISDIKTEIINTHGKKKLLAFRWYGGKLSHVDWILPLLPQTKYYCEPFGGSAAILLNKEPSEVETYNDIDGEVVNFFRVLRDKTEELIFKLYLTPFSREEFEKSINLSNDTDEVTRAFYFFVRAEQVRIGLAQRATKGRWAYCKKTSRRGKAGAISRWQNRIDALWLVARRLRDVQIENDDAFSVIEKYDDKDTLFYCDPPYIHSARTDRNAYKYEMDFEQHKKLSNLLNNISGKVALSGYDDPYLRQLYKNWVLIKAPEKTIHSSKAKRQECLWLNYEPDRNVVKALKKQGFEVYEP